MKSSGSPDMSVYFLRGDSLTPVTEPAHPPSDPSVVSNNYMDEGSYLKGDVIKLAAAADGGSARMNHPVHRNDARAAPRSFPSPFPAGAGSSFPFGSLLARHLSRKKWEFEPKKANIVPFRARKGRTKVPAAPNSRDAFTYA